MSNASGLPDPTAEQAIANVSKKTKASRYLPKELHLVNCDRVMVELCGLFGYDITEIRFRSREDEKEYLWSEWV